MISSEEKKQLDMLSNCNYNSIEFDHISKENLLIDICKNLKNQLYEF